MSIWILTLVKHIGLESRTQLNFNFISFLCFEAQPIITCSQSTLHIPLLDLSHPLCSVLANFLPIYLLLKLLRKDVFLAER